MGSAGTITLSYTSSNSTATSVDITITMKYKGNGETYNHSPSSGNCSIKFNGVTKTFTHAYTTSTTTQTMGSATWTVSRTHSAQNLTATGTIKNYSTVYDNPVGTLAISIKRQPAVTISFHRNGGMINSHSSPHQYSSSLYFQTTSSSNFIQSCSTRNGTYSKYTKTLYADTTTWDCYDTGSFGITKTGYSPKSGAEWNLKQDGSGTSFGQNTGTNWTTKRLNGGSNPAVGETASVNVYLQWVANTYTVTLNRNNGSGGTASVTATYGSAMPSISVPSRTGYNFAGYYDATSGGTKYYNANGTSAKTWDKASATTLYARWTAKTTTVTFNPNGGTLNGSSGWGTDANTTNNHVSTFTYDSSTGYGMGAATKSHYDFNGWWTATSGGTQVYYSSGWAKQSSGYWSADGASGNPNNAVWKNANSSATLYARWVGTQYTATVVSSNTSYGTVTGGGTYYYGDSVTITATPKTGYHFTGWTYSNGWTGSNTNASVTLTITTSGTATANFAPNTYSVRFNANGGSGSMANQTGFTYGTAKTLNANMFTAPAGGYSFYGWATSQAAANAGTRTYVNQGNMTTPSGIGGNNSVVDIYAIWSRTLTFKTNWASSPSTSTVTQYYGGSITMPAVGSLSSGNWTALGWRDDTSAAGKEYGGASATTVAYTGTGQTLYSVYSRTLTISYAANGGSGTTPSNTTTTQYYTTYGNITMPSVTLATNPYTKSGQSFAGWLVSTSNTTVNSGGTYTWDTGSTATTLSRTATAQWAANLYTLTVDPNGGVWEGSANTQTFSQTSGSIRNIPIPHKPGCMFVGWAEIGSGSLSKHIKGSPASTIDTDPSFDSSTGGVVVYNNSGNSTNGYHVTHTRQSSSAGYGSYEIQIVTDSSGTVSPQLGGFCHSTGSSADTTYLHSFVAKLPVGYTLQHAENQTGTNRFVTWLTPQIGTGKYETYAYIHRCGSAGGTFSTFGHVYVLNGTRPLTWQLACSNMIHITNGLDEVYNFGAGNGTIKALWTPMQMWARVGSAWKQCQRMWIRENNQWKPAADLWGTIDEWTKGPYYNQNLFMGTALDETIASSSSTDWTKHFRYYNGSASIHSISGDTDTITLNSASNLGVAFGRLAAEIDLDSNSWYTISCEAKSSQTAQPLCIGLSYLKTDDTWHWNGGANPQTFNQANVWQNFSVTFKPAPDTKAIDYCFTVYGTANGTATLSIRHCKLEKGVIATPWTGAAYYESDPAPLGETVTISYTWNGTGSIPASSKTITELNNVPHGYKFNIDGVFRAIPQQSNVVLNPIIFRKGSIASLHPTYGTSTELTGVTITYDGDTTITVVGSDYGSSTTPLGIVFNTLSY